MGQLFSPRVIKRDNSKIERMLTLVLSCMFAGKTETLIAYARRFILAKKKVVLVKYSKDTRYTVEDEICSHNLNRLRATFSCDNLKSIIETRDIQDADIVLIDEIQFFSDAPMYCDFLASQGKKIIAAGLNGNYKREEFPVISKLIPLAEEVIFLSAVCSRCGENAHFTKRIIEADGIEFIGGLESYEPRCRKCFTLEEQRSEMC